MRTYLSFVCLAATLSSCSPLKSSPQEEKHQLELTLRGLQTNLDDQRRDLNCFQTELQILDGRIKYYENALSLLKQNELEKQQAKLELVQEQFQALEKRVSTFAEVHESESKDLRQLLTHANETTAALAQFKGWIHELEQQMDQHSQRIAEMSKLKGRLDTLAKQTSSAEGKVHKVRPGESLEKIARMYKVSLESLKQENHLEQDLIVIGQKLRIPPSP